MNLRRVLSLFALALLVLGAGTLGMAACSSIPEDIGLADGRLRPCPSSPNCVCSEETRPEASVEPLAFDGDGEAALSELVALLESQFDARLVTRDGNYAHLVFRTPILRFADDVELRLDAGAACIHLRSASRVGHSDLGANRDRVEAIRSAWDGRTR